MFPLFSRFAFNKWHNLFTSFHFLGLPNTVAPLRRRHRRPCFNFWVNAARYFGFKMRPSLSFQFVCTTTNEVVVLLMTQTHFHGGCCCCLAHGTTDDVISRIAAYNNTPTWFFWKLIKMWLRYKQTKIICDHLPPPI